MRIKVLLIMVLVPCICGTVMFAQEELPPLESKSIIWYTVPIQLPSTCLCLKTSPLTKKQGLVRSVDIMISSLWDTVKEDRIQDHTIQFGGTAMPWRDTVMFGGWPVLKINFADTDFRTSLEGGVMKTLNVSTSRTMKQVRGVLEGAVWHVLIGAEGFFGQEQIPRATKSVNFEADFRRRSYGGQGWVGVKFGDFNRSFIVGRYGKGYAQTEGSNHFNVPGIDILDWFPVYFEEFRIASVSIEGKAMTKRISQSVRFDRVEYERVVPSPDSLRFGENHFQDMWLRTETEIIPFSRARFLRGVVIFTKDFRDQNRLMFINDYSSLRVLFRLAF